MNFKLRRFPNKLCILHFCHRFKVALLCNYFIEDQFCSVRKEDFALKKFSRGQFSLSPFYPLPKGKRQRISLRISSFANLCSILCRHIHVTDRNLYHQVKSAVGTKYYGCKIHHLPSTLPMHTTVIHLWAACQNTNCLLR